MAHPFANGQAARQPGALYAQAIHPALVPVLESDDEVVEIVAHLPGAPVRQLGPYARVIGLQARLVQMRQVRPDLADGLLQPGPAHGQVLRVVDPLDVRAEAHAAAHVEREVGAQAGGAGVRGRVDEAREVVGPPRGRVREVVALGVVQRLAPLGRHNHVVDMDGAQTCGVDDGVGRDGCRRRRRRR